jgi:hypothetical protein
MAITNTSLGLQKPDGSEAVRDGDNIMSANAQKVDDLIVADRGRLTNIEGAGYVPAWKTATAYTAGQRVISPGGDVVAAIANHTSTTYTPANWTASTQDGRIKTLESAAFMPAWKPTTAYTAGQRVIAPNGDVVAAIATHTSGASYTPANWTASTQDGRIKTLETNSVFTNDTRLMDASPIEGMLFAVTGTDDRRTWVEIGPDGKPTTRSTSLIGAAVGIVDTPLDSGQPFAVVDKNDRILFTPTDAVGYTKPQLPTDDWAHWGDSMTYNGAPATGFWTDKMAALTGRSHYNGGVSGQKATDIAARQGGLPALVTVPSNTIPTTGTITLTSIINNPVRVNTALQIWGTLAGVYGYLQEAVVGTQTFTRAADGAAVTCPPKTRFIPDAGQTYRNRTVTIWSGRNNVFDGTTAQQLVASIRAQLDFLGPDVKRAIIISVPSGDGLPATHATLAAFNNAISAAFPAQWLDLDSWLKTTDAATAAGITFTSDDNTDIAAGITPRSFRVDYTHPNAAGATAIAYRVNLEAQNRGWL